MVERDAEKYYEPNIVSSQLHTLTSVKGPTGRFRTWLLFDIDKTIAAFQIEEDSD